MENQTNDPRLYRAKERIEKLKGFYWHLITYIIVNIVLIIIIGGGIVRGGGSFWNFGTFSVAFFWGIGLAFHALGVFGLPFIFGKQWEERKIKEFMDKDREDYRSKKY